MARHIKKRCEERINLFMIEDTSEDQKNANNNIMMDE